jgi:hypothetical protein
VKYDGCGRDSNSNWFSFQTVICEISCIEKILRPSDLVLTLSCFCFINCKISREARVKVNDYPYEFQKPLEEYS